MHRRTILTWGAALIATILSLAAQASQPSAPPLTTALEIDIVTNAVTVSADGRVFLGYPRLDGSTGPRVVEWRNGRTKPFPNEGWNDWTPGRDAANTFVRANALRIGPEGDLWIVDVGAPGLGNPKLTDGPKIVRVNLSTNTVRRIYRLDAVTREKSFIDDIRFNGRNAYITDAGAPAIIVLDLESGAARRVLEGHASVTAQRPLKAEGRIVRGPDGNPLFVHADQLEVSPDGTWLFYQPISGPLHRIETRWLDDSAVNDAERAKHVERFVETGSTGGTAIDAAGNIYISDTDRLRVLKIAPDRTVTTLIQDPRLLWVDAMWIDDEGWLWMPAAQMNRIAAYQGGRSRVEFPIKIYKLRIDQEPVRR